MVVSITNDVGIMGFVSDTARHGPGPGSRDAAEQDRNPIKVSSKLADIYTEENERIVVGLVSRFRGGETVCI